MVRVLRRVLIVTRTDFSLFVYLVFTIRSRRYLICVAVGLIVSLDVHSR